MPDQQHETTLAGEPPYIFQRDVLGRDIIRQPVPGLYAEDSDIHDIWIIGPPLSGTAFHYHHEAWTGE
eukprot:SAG22_NODE_2373_length_2643_cov_2.521619_2_plen_68_part_00